MSQENLSDLAVQMYYQTSSAKRIEAAAAGQRSRRAARPLCGIAVAHTLHFLITLAILGQLLSDGVGAAWLTLAIIGGLTAAFWGLWAWSLSNPLPAAILGLLLYTSIWYAYIAQYPDGPPNQAAAFGFLVGLVCVGFLGKAILNASHERRILLALNNPTDAVQSNRPRGIGSAIWLYIALLGIVVIPISLAAKNNFNFHDLLEVHERMAIVIAAWVGIAWRDTLPAIRNPASKNWYVMAVLFGMSTALFASLYVDILSAFTGSKTMNYSQPLLANGTGWLGAIGLVALFPAVFEELAFRGVILPCLQRLLTNNEAIVVSGTMFMILHLSPASAPPLLVVGLLLGYVRVKSGSIWPCMLIHFTHNAMALAFEHWKF